MTDAHITGHEIHLVRRDIASLASTSPGCMVLYPIGKKSRQRIGVGNKSGDVSVFSFNKSVGRVPVFDTPPQSKPVSCVTLYEDQIFFVYGSRLEAYSRKGKHFFSFDTNVTESIHSIFVSTPFIITCGSFMVTSFQEVKELGFYMAPDRINAMVAFVATTALERTELTFGDYQCVIGCNDRMIRVLRNHQLTEEIRCESSPSALCVSHTMRKLYYGTHAGSLGCLDLSQSDSSLPRDFTHIPREHESAVTALSLFDVNADGRDELLVGRQDGTVQVFLLLSPTGHEEATATATATANATAGAGVVCVWAGHADEGVLAVAGGFVTHARHPDVLAHSFSGRLAAFAQTVEATTGAEALEATTGAEALEATTGAEALEATTGAEALEATTGAEALEATTGAEALQAEEEIRAVQAEIDALRRSIADASRALTESTGAAQFSAPLVAVASTFTARVQLTPLHGSPALLLVVEADTPLQCVALQSDVALRFVDTEGAPAAAAQDNDNDNSNNNDDQQNYHHRYDADLNSYNNYSSYGGDCEGRAAVGPLRRGGTRAVLRPVDARPYRCASAFIAAEQQWGALRVTILAAPTPRTAQVRLVPLPPLPLLARASDEAQRADLGDMSTLDMRGSFGARDVHAWLARMLSGMPERYNGDGPALRYECEFTRAVLHVSYGDGTATLLGNSLPTLSVARRFLAACAMERSIEVRFLVTVHKGALRTDLQHIVPRIAALNRAKRDMRLLEALRELHDDAADTAGMLEEHRQLLARADEVVREGKQTAQWEDYLRRVLVALHESAAEVIPGTPSTSPASRQRLEEIMRSSCDEALLMEAIERVLTPQNT